jgi:hypothetical protein
LVSPVEAPPEPPEERSPEPPLPALPDGEDAGGDVLDLDSPSALAPEEDSDFMAFLRDSDG